VATSRDDRHRKAAARLHDLTVGLAAEVVARRGDLSWYPDLTDAERTEAEERARRFWRDRMLAIKHRSYNNGVEASRKMDRLASTAPPP
jgi:hypothetical protein